MVAEPGQTSPHAEVPFNPDGQQVGAVYGKALVGATEATGQTEAVLAELNDLVTEVLDPFPAFDQVLSSELVLLEDKHGILDRVLGSRISPLSLVFLKVLAEHGRLPWIRDIRRAAQACFDELRGRVNVQITTAKPLDEAQAARISQRLGEMLGGQPRLVRHIDSKLIGGVVLRVGDTILDGSVASRLGQLRTQMINRSVHEIQSRRDRFRNPDGN